MTSKAQIQSTENSGKSDWHTYQNRRLLKQQEVNSTKHWANQDLSPQLFNDTYLQRTIGNRAIGHLLASPSEEKNLKSISETSPSESSLINSIQSKSQLLQTPNNITKQNASTVQRAPIVLLGLTAPEIAGLIGTTVGVANAIGTVAQKLNKQTGRGAMMKLNMSNAAFIISEKSKAQLENITRALFFQEVDLLNKRGQKGNRSTKSRAPKDSQDDLRETAKGNVKQKITRLFNSYISATTYRAVANGAGGHSYTPPWGEAIITYASATIYPSYFSKDIYATANAHGIIINAGEPVTFVKYCTVDFAFEANEGIVSNDNIYVRGEHLDAVEDNNEIAVKCVVAFDWDGETTYYEWKDEQAFRPGESIKAPNWQGTKDPDD